VQRYTSCFDSQSVKITDSLSLFCFDRDSDKEVSNVFFEKRVVVRNNTSYLHTQSR